MNFLTRLEGIYELDTQRSRSQAMEGVRGFAVLLVFFVHCFGLILSRRIHADIEPLSLHAVGGANKVFLWLFMSHHGVYLFFILSGFLICHILQRSSFRYLRFIWMRVLRIYPAFLFSLAACILAGMYFFRDVAFDLDVFLKNLVFLNGLSILKIPAYNQVTWSLFNEFVFYLVFPSVFLLIGPKLFHEKWRMVVLGLCVVYGPILVGYIDARFSFFFAGAFIALFREEELRRFADKIPNRFVIALYVFSTLAWAYRIVDFGTYLLFFLVGGSLLFIKASYGEGLLPRLFATRGLRYLGNISYSFYLIHALVLNIVFSLLGTSLDVLSVGPGMIVLIAVAFGASWIAATAMFLALERPYFVRAKSDIKPVVKLDRAA